MTLGVFQCVTVTYDYQLVVCVVCVVCVVFVCVCGFYHDHRESGAQRVFFLYSLALVL